MKNIEYTKPCKYLEVITLLGSMEHFEHNNCRMGLIKGVGLFVQKEKYEYFYPERNIVRVVTEFDQG